MGKPSWLDKKEDPRSFSQKRERSIAKRMGAKLTPNSGARWHSKGDMENAEQLIEVKSTAASSMTVHKDWLKKIREEAIKEGKSAVFVVDFGDIQLIGNVVLTKEKLK